MKRTTPVCILGLCASILSPTATHAALAVSFVEGPSETAFVTVNFSPVVAAGLSGGWWNLFSGASGIGSESATFTGYTSPISAANTTGHFIVGLIENAGSTVPSDYVTIDWVQDQLNTGTSFINATKVTLVFQSDTDGQTLGIPTGYPTPTIKLEDGTLQTFDITAFPGGLTVGIQSDAAVVPEPSTYVAGALMLLPFGASAFRILRKK